jgi:hypothetical protein
MDLPLYKDDLAQYAFIGFRPPDTVWNLLRSNPAGLQSLPK